MYSGEEGISDQLVAEIDRLAKISDPNDDQVDLLVSLLYALATCDSRHYRRMLEISSVAISDHSVDITEAALRVIAVVAASEPELVGEISDHLLPLLSVDQPSAVVTELSLENFSRISEISDLRSLADSSFVNDVVVHYASATEKISDLQELMGDNFPIAEVPGLPTAKFAAQVILKLAEISDQMSEILAKAEIPITEVSSFANI